MSVTPVPRSAAPDPFVVAFYDARAYDRTSFLKAPGAEAVDWLFFEHRLDAKTAVTAQGARAVCVFVSDRVDRPCLQQLRALGVEMVALRCAGFNNVDLDAARELGLAVTRVPAYSPHAVAEHTVGLLLTLNRRIHRAYNRVRELNFSLHGLVGHDLAGRTASIIGTGKIGRLVAQILRGFDMQVLCHDPFPDAAWAARLDAHYVDLPEALRRGDVVSLHTPLTDQTYHLLDTERLGWMKRGAFLLNTSRGKLVDTAALIAQLKGGRLGGVALDVYEEEEGIFFNDLSDAPLADDVLARLLTFRNVLVTSHQAFLTHEALGEIARVTIANLAARRDGHPFLDGTALAG